MARQAKLDGFIAAVEELGKTNSGYRKYDITFEDGSIEEIMIQPDCTYKPNVDDEIFLYEGRFGGWLLDKEAMGLMRNSSRDNGRGSYNKSGGNNKDDYWKKREEHEQAWKEYQKEERDPELQFQSYFHDVTAIAATMTTEKSTLQGMMDQIYNVTNSIVNRRNDGDLTEEVDDLPCDNEEEEAEVEEEQPKRRTSRRRTTSSNKPSTSRRRSTLTDDEGPKKPTRRRRSTK